MKLEKKLVSLGIALAMVITMAPVFGVEAYATGTATDVKYIDADGTEKTTSSAIIIEGTDTKRANWVTGWYVVSGSAVLSEGAKVLGHVHLILADGASLTIDSVADNNAGIEVTGDTSTLTIYGQSAGTGELNVTGGNLGAGIGGGKCATGSDITINGGKVTATGGRYGAGIGGGWKATGSSITVNDGEVTAKGGYFSAGIGGGNQGNGNNITINGGKVTATGGTFETGTFSGGAGIGGGKQGSGSDIIINGGTVTATGGYSGAGIGGGYAGDGLKITINNGTVDSQGGEKGAGIGGGLYSIGIGGVLRGDGCDITINGGTVTAKGGSHASGIGGGGNDTQGGKGSNITINGGTVKAYGGTWGAGIGGGVHGNGSNIIIRGGTVTAEGNTCGAGIGGGAYGNGSSIEISGGTVTSIGGDGNVFLSVGSAIGGGGYDSSEPTTTSAICINKKLIIKADSINPPVTEIAKSRSDDTDISSELAGKRYANIIPSICLNTITGKLYTSADGIQSAIEEVGQGETIQLTANVAISAYLNIVQGQKFTLDLNGYVLSGNGNRVIYNNGNLSIVDTNSGHQTHYYTVNNDGLWVWDDSKTAGAVTVNNITSTPSAGTVVALPGGAITGGNADKGGGIFISGNSTLSMTGGNICGNSATSEGGGLWTGNTVNIELRDVNIIGNTAGKYGGALINTHYSSTTIGGIVRITANTATASASCDNNLTLWDVATKVLFNVDSLTQGSKIGITPRHSGNILVGTITQTNNQTVSKYFFSDDNKYEVIPTTGGIALINARTSQSLSFASISINKTEGDASFTNTLTGAATTVTYSSSNENVATVASTGAVTIVGVGNTIITATATESVLYKSATASYTLTVSAKQNKPSGNGGGSNTVIVSVSGDKNSVEESEESSYKTCKHDDSCELSKFPDVDIDDWYHDGMHFCVENGYINGTNWGLLQPNADITRAQVCMILWNIEGKPVVDYAMNFSDVKETDWFAEAVRWAASEGIVSGHKGLYEGQFWPETAITREQLAQVLYNYAKTKDMGFTGEWMFLISNSDADQINGWAGEAMHWTVMKQITSGDAFGLLKPQSNATRAEAATMIKRFCEAIAE